MIDTDTIANIKSDTEDKRVASPTRELSFIISFVEKIYKELKPGVYHSKEDIASVQNLAVNSIKSLLSTAQQYDLLELKYGVGYKVSSLFEKIYLSANEEDKKNSILKSLHHPPIYREIFKEYDGKSFPGKQEVKRFIDQKFDIKNTVSKKIVEILFQNLNEYKILNNSNVLPFDIAEPHIIAKEAKIVFKKPVKEFQFDPLPVNIIDKTQNENADMIEIIIPLKNKLKAILKIPENHTNADLEKIARIVQAYKEVTQG